MDVFARLQNSKGSNGPILIKKDKHNQSGEEHNFGQVCSKDGETSLHTLAPVMTILPDYKRWMFARAFTTDVRRESPEAHGPQGEKA